jgi:hypothetical protein
LEEEVERLQLQLIMLDKHERERRNQKTDKTPEKYIESKHDGGNKKMENSLPMLHFEYLEPESSYKAVADKNSPLRSRQVHTESKDDVSVSSMQTGSSSGEGGSHSRVVRGPEEAASALMSLNKKYTDMNY